MKNGRKFPSVFLFYHSFSRYLGGILEILAEYVPEAPVLRVFWISVSKFLAALSDNPKKIRRFVEKEGLTSCNSRAYVIQ